MILRWILVLLCLAVPAGAAGEAGYEYDDAPPLDRTDYASLQRGAASFVAYCMGCHSARHVRYDHIGRDLGISEEVINRHFSFGQRQYGDYLISAMPSGNSAEWFNEAAPPDLSLSARLRGIDWLYAYLRGFYRDQDRPTGWNNAVFPNVAMPNVLAGLQGEQTYDSSTHRFATIRSGALSAAEYDLFVADLINFMDYMADPKRPARHRAGYIVLSFLMILLVLTFFLYREYWRDIR
jgi:ubiquinol-cytochrome c reductase cytochrome c1 subunit